MDLQSLEIMYNLW